MVLLAVAAEVVGPGRVGQKVLPLAARKPPSPPPCRYRDDAELDQLQRGELRDGDPMAAMMQRKAEKKAKKDMKKAKKAAAKGDAEAAAKLAALAAVKPK